MEAARKMRVAIICARGGSKGLPDKNVKEIKGIPLVAHSILQAKDSKMFDKVVLSSDSDKILQIAKDFGALAVKRPAEMASDEAGIMPAVKHALLETEKECALIFETICLLQPTSPLRTAEDIKGAILQLESSNKENIFSVCKASSSPYYNMIEVFEGKVQLCKQGNFVRRQDAPTVYELNGAIYAWKREAFLDEAKVISANSDIFVMPNERSVDIDTELDFRFAKFLMES